MRETPKLRTRSLTMHSPKMRNRRILVIVAIICVLAFVFAAPIRNVEAPDGCLNCVVHFQRSLSCEFVEVGDYYWDGSLSFGCGGPVIP